MDIRRKQNATIQKSSRHPRYYFLPNRQTDVQNKLIYFNPVAVFCWQQINGFNYHQVAFIVHDKHGSLQKQKLKPKEFAVLIKASNKYSKT